MKKSFFQSKNTAPLGGSDEAKNEVSFDATSAAEDASCAPNKKPIIAALQGRQDAAPGLLPNERSESINALQAPGTDPGSPKEILETVMYSKFLLDSAYQALIEIKAPGTIHIVRAIHALHIWNP